jgi:hypothetical protein
MENVTVLKGKSAVAGPKLGPVPPLKEWAAQDADVREFFAHVHRHGLRVEALKLLNTAITKKRPNYATTN